MTPWLLLRLIKWLGVLSLTGGTIGSLLSRDPDDRRRAVYVVATPGFVLAWFGGYGLARLSGLSLGLPWLSASMLASLASLALLVRSVEPERSRRGAWAALALLGLVVVLMVLRPGAVAAGTVTP